MNHLECFSARSSILKQKWITCYQEMLCDKLMHASNRKYLLILPEGNTGYAIEGV